jgi:hypothetical protein
MGCLPETVSDHFMQERSSVLRMDLSGLRKQRKDLILCGPHSQPLFALARGGFLEKIGEKNVCGDMEASLTQARQILLLKKTG